jgi:SAM-dependent methyltransferase
MLYPKLREFMQFLIATPLHPQWHIHRLDRSLKEHFENIHGDLLDVGAGNGKLKSIVPDTVDYIGLDYPLTTAKGYSGAVSVYGDGIDLPFKENSFDVVVMLDVLEHIPDAKKAFQESIRVLRPGGNLIIKVPFLYPIHDSPHDFQRWTVYGLECFSEEERVKVKYYCYLGEPGETAALIANLALCSGVLSVIKRGSFGIALAPIAVVLVPLINLVGYMMSKVFPRDNLMPLSYIIVYDKLN